MPDHATTARALLDQAWSEVIAEESTEAIDVLDESIDEILDGGEVGYKKLIVIQVAGKAADPSLDAHSLQKGAGEAGAWDAREFAKKVFVPWNARIGYPLGDADDPYVSNQFRNPRFDENIREKRKNKLLFDKAFQILEYAESPNSPDEPYLLLKRILRGIRRQMQKQSFTYAIPHRASLAAVLGCIQKYLSTASGGARLQAIAQALFEALRTAGIPFEALSCRHVNASDVSSNSPGDISSKLADSLWAAEIKDRFLTEAQVEVSVSKARVAGVTELLFLVHGSSSERIFETPEDERAIVAIALREFGSGLNIYCESFLGFARSALVLVGETGRRDFLAAVGTSLEMQRVDARHRWEWAQAVATL